MGDMVFWSDPLPPQDLAVGRLKGGEMTLHMPTWIRLHRLTVSTSQNICALRRRVTWIVTWIYLHNLKFMPPIVKTSILLMFSPWGRQEYVCCLHHSSADGLGSCSSGSSTLWLQKESIEQRHEASVQKKDTWISTWSWLWLDDPCFRGQFVDCDRIHAVSVSLWQGVECQLFALWNQTMDLFGPVAWLGHKSHFGTLTPTSKS